MRKAIREEGGLQEEGRYMIADGCYSSIISAKDESEAIDKYLLINGSIVYPTNFYVDRIIW